MSEEETFLARWARRKSEGRAQEPAPPASEASGEPPSPPSPAAAQSETKPLPPIESIGADSDISAFLAAGVPADLSRAALRRAWSADPAIRDFIGLSENSWDFTAPDGVPGFGPILQDEVARLLQHLTHEQEQIQAAEASAAAPQPALPQPAAATEAENQAAVNTVNAAMQQDPAPNDSATKPPRQRHGSALPD